MTAWPSRNHLAAVPRRQAGFADHPASSPGIDIESIPGEARFRADQTVAWARWWGYSHFVVKIERERRPFWIHQMIEYVIGIALISSSVQLPDPAVPALLGLLIILNAAVAKGSAGAFRLVGRRLHRTFDLVVIAILAFVAFQPWWSIDTTSRMLIGSIAFILCFVWFYTDFAEQRSRSERKAQRTAAKAARGPTDSTEIGRRAGRLVGGTVNSARRWKDGLSETAVTETARTETPPPAQWDPPTPPQ